MSTTSGLGPAARPSRSPGRSRGPAVGRRDAQVHPGGARRRAAGPAATRRAAGRARGPARGAAGPRAGATGTLRRPSSGSAHGVVDRGGPAAGPASTVDGAPGGSATRRCSAGHHSLVAALLEGPAVEGAQHVPRDPVGVLEHQRVLRLEREVRAGPDVAEQVRVGVPPGRVLAFGAGAHGRRRTPRRCPRAGPAGSSARSQQRCHRPVEQAPTSPSSRCSPPATTRRPGDHDVGDVGGGRREHHPLQRVGVGAAGCAHRVEPDRHQVGRRAPASSTPASGQPSDAWPARVAASSSAAADQCPRCCVASRSSSSTAAGLLEQVDHGVAVRAQGDRRAGLAHPAGRPDAVGQVALGRRAHAHRGAGAAEQLDVVVGEVGRVHGGACAGRARRGRAAAGSASRRRPARQASFSRALLGHVHVQRRLVAAAQAGDGAELVGRHGPHRVHGRADHDVGRTVVRRRAAPRRGPPSRRRRRRRTAAARRPAAGRCRRRGSRCPAA